mmetsp:Transcript_99481/g.136716  ORF Transcript_99481/g.136716 Transcript_99481/m.136716 type:complete len:149 (+) Transcript_99481:35-481(+)
MYSPEEFLGCLDLKWGAGTFGVITTLSAVETLLYTEMDIMTMFFWIMVDISVHTAWVLVLWKDSEDPKYRKGLYYAAKIGFYCALAAYTVIEFMLIEVISYLKTASRIEDLADSNAYNMLPGLMRLEEHGDHDDDMHDEDHDDDDMIR